MLDAPGKVSPGSGQGSGLKRRYPKLPVTVVNVSPGSGQGSGLKLEWVENMGGGGGVSPGSGQGSGLKHGPEGAL